MIHGYVAIRRRVRFTDVALPLLTQFWQGDTSLSIPELSHVLFKPHDGFGRRRDVPALMEAKSKQLTFVASAYSTFIAVDLKIKLFA